jgi:ABC-2 type transport system ATP-binding protein
MTDNPTRVIEFADVSCVEDGRTVLEGVTMAVRAGEVVALTGATRAGKTRVLEMALGQRPPASGTVSVLGRAPAGEAAEVRSQLGSVGEAPEFPPFLRVDDVLDIHRSLNTRWDSERATALLESLAVSRRALAGSLTLRERRRLALVCAVAGAPEILVIDEAEGDTEETAALIEAALEATATERPAILYATRADAPPVGRAIKLPQSARPG